MPSIFVWKAKQNITDIPSPVMIQYYSGANWFLEEHSVSSKSAIYLNQQALSNNGWMFDIKWMPNNWVGSHLLEVKSLSYSFIKEDNYACLEQIGDWMRATTKIDIPSESREKEWDKIQKWASDNQISTYYKDINSNMKNSSYHINTNDVPCLIDLSANRYVNVKPSHDLPYHFNRNNHQSFYQKTKMISS